MAERGGLGGLWAVRAAVAAQALCAAVFLYRVLGPVLGLPPEPMGWRWMEALELAAAAGLLGGVVLGAVAMREIRRRHARAEAALARARGEFGAVVEERFDGWGLTPAERDVALFSAKGLGPAEIAAARGVSEGTIKAQSAAIYRKAGVNGRAQLVAALVEDLL